MIAMVAFVAPAIQTTAPNLNNQAFAEPSVAETQPVVKETPKPKERTVKPEKAKPEQPKPKVVEPAQTVEVVTPQPTPVAIPQDKTVLMRQAGIPESDWTYVDSIITRESGWQHLVWNGTGSGAYGLCQSLPATKMASAGADYMTNPVTQLKWCHSYALGRYGSWLEAHNFWNINHWW